MELTRSCASDRLPRHLVPAIGLVVLSMSACVTSPTPTGPISAQPFPTATSGFLAEDVERWIRVRQAFGLQADAAWVVSVARDPRAVTDAVIPLLPEELDRVLVITRATYDARDVIERYGMSFPDEWAGIASTDPGLIAQFTGHVDDHRMALEALVDPRSVVEVREVEWTLRQLNGFQREIEVDHDWFPSVGAEYYASEVFPSANGVRVRYKADTLAVESAIARHLGEPGWLVLRMEGAPTWRGPRGSIRIDVVDPDGRAVDGLVCRLDPADPTVHLGDAAWFTEDGQGCRIDDIPAVAYVVTVQGDSPNGLGIVLGTLNVIVPEDGRGTARITVDRS